MGLGQPATVETEGRGVEGRHLHWRVWELKRERERGERKELALPHRAAPLAQCRVVPQIEKW